MSQIKATEIEGDVSVGRHIISGGNATVRGNAVVKKNLIVEGHLEARNIKGSDKGVFATLDKLRQVYPEPEHGWWALVGTSLPAKLYVVDDGEWVFSGDYAGDPNIDIQQYEEAITELNEDLQSLAATVGTIGSEASEALETAKGSQSLALTANKKALKAGESAVAAISKADMAFDRIDEFVGMTGKPNGLASLGEDGKVPASQLPEIPEQRVLSFGSVLMGEAPMVTAGTATGAGAVTFMAATKCFVFRSGMGSSATYFANWPGADAYGTATYTSGRTPHAGKLYISDAREVYLWDGAEFASVTASLSQALDMRLGGLSLRFITPEQDAEMTEAGTHDPGTIYFIPVEK